MKASGKGGEGIGIGEEITLALPRTENTFERARELRACGEEGLELKEETRGIGDGGKWERRRGHKNK